MARGATLAAFLGAASGLLLAAAPARAQLTNCQGRLIQPLDFRAPTLISGSALQTGAVYRFASVASGVDALVSIDAISNGSLAVIDRDAGLIANFQPELSAAGGDGTGPRSVDFTIRLVLSGTSSPVSVDFAASGIDIDGDSGNLREYAEFSTPFAEFALESPSRLATNASGPSRADNFRFESSTAFTAPGIDETATQNIVSIFYTATSSIRYRIGALGSGGTTRLTSLDFTCPNINFPTANPLVDQDFGDAPASYGNPRHDFVADFRIGATNTIESEPYYSADASGDAGDDGVALPTLQRGQSSLIDVSVAGANGRLQAFIDFGSDGSFTTSGDRIAADVTDGGAGDADGVANGVIRLAVSTPVSALAGATFARFRWSTQSGVDPLLTASNGEVEDYAVTILGVPDLDAMKTVDVFDPLNEGLFAIPGNDVVYTITVANDGDAAIDTDSIFMADTLPDELTFFNGDFDGPGSGPIEFEQSGSGLTLDLADDVGFSSALGAPASFSDCAYTPASGYDANVRHLCVNPKGAFATGDPAPTFTIRFRARID